MEQQEKPSFAQFSVKAVPDQLATREAGQAIFRNAIVITVAHSKNQIVEVECEDRHFKMFPREWAQFKETDDFKQFNIDDREAGNITPIENLKGTPSVIASLKAIGVKSVEAFAAKDEDAIAHFQGAKKLQARAKEMTAPKKATMKPEAA